MQSVRTRRLIVLFISLTVSILFAIFFFKFLQPATPFSNSKIEFSSTPTQSTVCPVADILESFYLHSGPVVIASCSGHPGFKMSLPNYPHLRHWLSDAIQNKKINIGADYLRYQDMFLRKRFSSNSVMVDVGCNHGLAALPVAALGHRVICFEPVRYNYEKLVQSQLFNNFKNPMTIIHAALGERSGNASIYVPSFRDDNASLNPQVSVSNLPNSEFHSETVSIITFDEFLDKRQDIDANKIEFVKVDVQGFEEFVMKGAVKFLQLANRNIIIECEFSPKMTRARGGDPANLLSFMHNQGFRFVANGVAQIPSTFLNFIHGLGDSQVDIEFVSIKRIQPI